MQLIFLMLLGGGWVLYIFGNSQPNWLLILLALAPMILGFRVRSGLRRTAAANNAVFAAATFQTLAPSQQMIVEDRVREILSKLHRPINGPDMMEHVARWGWYALAMRELGIDPIGELPAWNFVQNPLLALRPNDPYLLTTVERVQKSGLPVNISLFED